ncbi:MAG: TonB-dependent copper receptor [Aliidiomarina sp.]|uniref:TonB-dependent copper receptor n=1 Tax=Aliidiomarina sp. TaxID=1872439 RepID=UPI0025BC457F|nr:TonB-dependent copper receptor [Aliidiomarina sp.]MCH8500778.1 TonB-dependent copper receptor [Aliidiomarina sp.]
MKHHAVLSLLSVSILSILSHSSSASETEPTTDDNYERIQVVGQVMEHAGMVMQNTRVPVQPLPAFDGADYLRSITGFHAVRKGGASSDLVFRGMAGSRVMVLSDGEPLMGSCPSRMDPPTAYLSPQSFDHVVIVKGPQSVDSGPAASASTVNFTRATPNFDEQALQGFFSATAGSFERADTTTELTWGGSQGYVRLNHNFAHSSDYKDGSGNRVHSQFQRYNTQLTAAYTPSDRQELVFSIASGDGRVAYADRHMDGTKFYTENVALRWSLTDVNPLVSKVQLRGTFSYQDHVMDNFSLRPAMNPERLSASNPDRYSRGLAGFAEIDWSKQWQMKVGMDYLTTEHRSRVTMNDRMMPYKERPRVADSDSEQTSVYLQNVYTVNALRSLHVGIRADHWQAQDLREFIYDNPMGMGAGVANETAMAKRSETLWSGFIRHEWHWQDAHAYLGWGQSDRFPDYWELIGRNRASDESRSAFFTESERLQQVDAGLAWQRQHADYAVSVFYNDISDFILIELTDTGEFVRNVATASWGGEADASFKLTPQWQTGASISYVRGRNKTDGLPLAQQPPLSARFSVEYLQENWSLAAQWRLAAAQHRFAANQGTIAGLDRGERSPGFGVLSINATRVLTANATLYVGIDNLFDNDYAEHLSRNGAAVIGFNEPSRVPEPGRTVWASVNFRL